MLIEQQRNPIESAPKYNFPDISAAAFNLPQEIADLCILSMQKPQKHNILSKNPVNKPTFKPQMFAEPFGVIHFQPSYKDTSIVGTDVSSIKIGETKQGTLLAIRGAIVWNIHHRYHYLRLGPFLFHVTEDNKKQILNLLSQYQNDLPVELIASDSFHLQTRIAGILERWIQSNLCSTCSDSLILMDGSLTAKNPDTPESIVSNFLRAARARANVVLAFSKFSHVNFNGQSLTEIAERENPPCLVRVNGIFENSNGLKLLGSVYAAKFNDDAFCFRLDVDKDLLSSRVLDAVQRLLGNDMFHHGHGYPETLRLAHIYCTFTANEVIGMQRYLEHERELKIMIKPNIRRLLFGPFGKGLEA